MHRTGAFRIGNACEFFRRAAGARHASRHSCAGRTHPLDLDGHAGWRCRMRAVSVLASMSCLPHRCRRGARSEERVRLIALKSEGGPAGAQHGMAAAAKACLGFALFSLHNCQGTALAQALGATSARQVRFVAVSAQPRTATELSPSECSHAGAVMGRFGDGIDYLRSGGGISSGGEVCHPSSEKRWCAPPRHCGRRASVRGRGS